MEMRAKARRLKMEVGLDMIMVDYLQLMAVKGKVESRQQEISQISRSLKAVAKELNVPVLSLSQLSRRPEQRAGDHRPQLADLRESGAIEQDADVVCFIYRDEVYNKDTEEKGIAEIIIAKQRNGPIGDFKLVFRNDITKFFNYEPQPEYLAQ
jgi:replicative DNA helicase